MATCIMAIYILMGLCGIPVFASGGGIYYLVKPTFGFVLGFLFASMICSYGANKKVLESFKDYFIEGLKGDQALAGGHGNTGQENTGQEDPPWPQGSQS